MDDTFQIRIALPEEYEAIGELMVKVYSMLEGFPSPEEQPAYYNKLASIGLLAEKPGVELLAAVDASDKVGGAVVYFDDLRQYGAQGTADNEADAAGFRLLAVDPSTRGQGLGKKLTQACLNRAKTNGKKQVVIHSTKAMQVAWGMYEKLGFVRAETLDFMQEGFPVYGFRLLL